MIGVGQSRRRSAQTAASLARDRDAETLWCGDVAALKADLAQAGGDLVIEKALAIGATPLKRIEVAGQAPGIEVARAPGLKTFKPGWGREASAAQVGGGPHQFIASGAGHLAECPDRDPVRPVC
ncbi:hypothetical protein [Caulobacter sp. LARHSG274]